MTAPARSLLVATAIVVAFATGVYIGRRTLARNANQAERAAIDRLHEQDVAATLAGDPAALTQLWTDDAVRLEQGSAATVGKQAIFAADQRDHNAHPDSRKLSPMCLISKT